MFCIPYYICGPCNCVYFTQRIRNRSSSDRRIAYAYGAVIYHVHHTCRNASSHSHRCFIKYTLLMDVYLMCQLSYSFLNVLAMGKGTESSLHWVMCTVSHFRRGSSSPPARRHLSCDAALALLPSKRRSRPAETRQPDTTGRDACK